MKKIRILQIIPSLPLAGAELILYNICKGLLESAPSYLFQVLTLFEKGPLSSRFETSGISVECMHLKRSDPLWLKLLITYNHVKDLNPDIIHTHLYDADRYGQVAAFLNRIPCRILTLHGMEPTRNLKERIWDRVSGCLATEIVAVSQSARQIWGDRHSYPLKKMRTIYNAMASAPTTAIAPRIHPPSGRLKRWVSVGRLSPEKGHLDLIRAFHLLHSAYPEQKLDIYGGGICYKLLTEEIAKLDLTASVKLMGVIPDIHSVLSDYDAYVSASYWEGFGMANIEAMANGLPAIISDIPAHREIFDYNEPSIFFKPGDVQLLFRTMERLIKDDILYKYLSTHNISRSSFFSLQEMVRAYNAIYSKALTNACPFP